VQDFTIFREAHAPCGLGDMRDIVRLDLAAVVIDRHRAAIHHAADIAAREGKKDLVDDRSGIFLRQMKSCLDAGKRSVKLDHFALPDAARCTLAHTRHQKLAIFTDLAHDRANVRGSDLQGDNRWEAHRRSPWRR